jgi:hypothetical protein
MILFGAKLQFMNGEVRANILVRKMPKNQQAPLFFPRLRKTEATPAKETNTNINKLKVATSR